MVPDIFMNDFERTEYGDAYYAAIGRILTLASRFEFVVKTLSLYVGFKKRRSLLDSDSDLEEFIRKLRKMPLARHISDLGLDEDSVGTVLRVARSARNEIAHELTLGFDRCLDTLPKEQREGLIKHLESLATKLAEGDKIVSYLASVLAGEHLPRAKFLNEYPARVVAWICEL